MAPPRRPLPSAWTWRSAPRTRPARRRTREGSRRRRGSWAPRRGGESGRRPWRPVRVRTVSVPRPWSSSVASGSTTERPRRVAEARRLRRHRPPRPLMPPRRGRGAPSIRGLNAPSQDMPEEERTAGGDHERSDPDPVTTGSAENASRSTRSRTDRSPSIRKGIEGVGRAPSTGSAIPGTAPTGSSPTTWLHSSRRHVARTRKKRLPDWKKRPLGELTGSPTGSRDLARAHLDLGDHDQGGERSPASGILPLIRPSGVQVIDHRASERCISTKASVASVRCTCAPPLQRGQGVDGEDPTLGVQVLIEQFHG